MSDEPVKNDEDEIDAGPFKFRGHVAVISVAAVIAIGLIAWAVVSSVSIRHGGGPVPIPQVTK